MNCREMKRVFMGEDINPRDRRHILGCANCQQTLLGVGAWEVLPDLIATPGKRPSEGKAPQGLPVPILLAALASIAAIAIWRLGTDGYAELRASQAAGLGAAGGVLFGLFTGAAARQCMPGKRLYADPRLLLVVSVAALFASVLAIYPAGDWNAMFALTCIGKALPYVAASAVPLLALSRKAVILSPSWYGAAAGSLAGMIGFIASTVSCPLADKWHALAAHCGVVFVGGLGGWAIGYGIEWFRRRQFPAPPILVSE